ncbi:hypothetical protein SAMN05192553_101329 [Cyclobacterium xiamenense]|uniref:Uncharacterized protein n=1 Tax=Cyclobacterium xiamenense TaxID=1297121 RepID=A0A1H6TID0_9BACT|nr:hypothetical protein SAMN05192553_101329 [Cyclobacterium xiamenense]
MGTGNEFSSNYQLQTIDLLIRLNYPLFLLNRNLMEG